jgi:hypothetical protein
MFNFQIWMNQLFVSEYVKSPENYGCHLVYDSKRTGQQLVQLIRNAGMLNSDIGTNIANVKSQADHSRNMNSSVSVSDKMTGNLDRRIKKSGISKVQ